MQETLEFAEYSLHVSMLPCKFSSSSILRADLAKGEDVSDEQWTLDYASCLRLVLICNSSSATTRDATTARW